MFRVTIREMLWLTTIAALAIGWLIHTRSEQTDDQFLQIQLMEPFIVTRRFPLFIFAMDCNCVLRVSRYDSNKQNVRTKLVIVLGMCIHPGSHCDHRHETIAASTY
jgi:hypothetical protein